MRILIFSLVNNPNIVGGAEIAINEIVKRIDPEEITFDIIGLQNPNLIQKLFYPIYAFIKAKKFHKKNKYDATWSMMASYAGFAGYLFKKAYKDIPCILSLQEGENFWIRNTIFKPFFSLIIKNADFIQVISNFLGDWARDMGSKNHIEVIPNAVDYKLFFTKKSHAENEILKRDLRKKMDDIFLVTTSRLVKKNAVEDIIDSLQYLPKSVKLMVIGQGKLEEKLKEKVSKMGFKDRVLFLGFIKHKDLPQYLHISDIFIRPALSEGFGNSYIEAMATGIPVIATPVGGIVDFLKDGETGLFCEVKNPKSIAQKVEKLIKDRESRDFIVRNAIEMVKSKYDWDLIANDMKNKVFLRVI